MYELIKEEEGFRSTAYVCAGGHWTIGYGSTQYKDGTFVKEGDTINERDAEELLEYHISNRIELPKGDWTDNQKDALYSLIYNIGQGAFNRSKCRRALEAGDWQTAYNNWDWVRAGGRVRRGLVRRRDRERKQFFEGLIA